MNAKKLRDTTHIKLNGVSGHLYKYGLGSGLSSPSLVIFTIRGSIGKTWDPLLPVRLRWSFTSGSPVVHIQLCSVNWHLVFICVMQSIHICLKDASYIHHCSVDTETMSGRFALPSPYIVLRVKYPLKGCEPRMVELARLIIHSPPF